MSICGADISVMNEHKGKSAIAGEREEREQKTETWIKVQVDGLVACSPTRK
jgi:hypothetical protein